MLAFIVLFRGRTAAGMLITIGWGYVSTNIVLGRVNGGQFSVG